MSIKIALIFVIFDCFIYFIILNKADKLWVINDKSCIFVADYSAMNYARITHR